MNCDATAHFVEISWSPTAPYDNLSTIHVMVSKVVLTTTIDSEARSSTWELS